MFDKLKQLNDLRKIQQTIKEHKVETEKNGVTVALRGDFEVLSITLNPSLDIRTQEQALIAALNDARDKMQHILAQQFAGQLKM